MGIDVNASHRRGGLEHEYWKDRVTEHFRKKGYRVTEEYPVGGGQAVDLVAVNDKERIAIEIETGKSDAVHNIQRALKAGFVRIVCVALDGKVEQKINEQLKNIDLPESGNIVMVQIQDLLESINRK